MTDETNRPMTYNTDVPDRVDPGQLIADRAKESNETSASAKVAITKKPAAKAKDKK